MRCARATASGAREARFVARVLASTTRQDLSWRGDLRLFVDFLRARLRASPALRIVAASLALHLVAGPAVAYWMFRSQAPERRPRLQFELPSESPFAPPPPAATAETDELQRLARRAEAIENERARERFLLARRGATAPAPDLELADAAPTELRLLETRARLLRDPWSGERGALDLPAPGASVLARILGLELALDALVLQDRTDAFLGPAARALELERPEALEPGAAVLLERALERARRLGVLEPASPAEVDRDGLPLLDPDWFEALERAGSASGLAAAPTWAAWVAWGRS